MVPIAGSRRDVAADRAETILIVNCVRVPVAVKAVELDRGVTGTVAVVNPDWSVTVVRDRVVLNQSVGYGPICPDFDTPVAVVVDGVVVDLRTVQVLIQHDPGIHVVIELAVFDYDWNGRRVGNECSHTVPRDRASVDGDPA